MGFFDFFKKEEAVVELELSIDELSTKIKDELLELEQVKPELIEGINSELGELKKSINILINAKVNEEVSMALLIGVNNSRRVLCNLIDSGIIIKNPDTLTGLNEYLKLVNNLINKAHKAFNRHGGRVTFIYKKETSKLTTALDNLSLELKSCTEKINEGLARIKSLKSVEELILKYESLLNKLSDLKEDSSLNHESLIELKGREKELQSELKNLSGSNELIKAEENKERINELRDELKNLERRADFIISDFSKALKRFSHGSKNKIFNLLLSEPLMTISEFTDDFIKVRDAVLRELESGAIALKDKQLSKTKESLSSNELIELAGNYSRINNELKTLSSKTGAISVKSGIESSINKLTRRRELAEKEGYGLKADINSVNKELSELLERVKGKAGSVFNSVITLKNIIIVRNITKKK